MDRSGNRRVFQSIQNKSGALLLEDGVSVLCFQVKSI